MAYADYEFYKTKYHGNSIAEADFEKWSDWASRKIDVYTSRRLLTVYPADLYADEQIKMCVCALAERIQAIDMYLNAQKVREDGTAGIVQSKSAGAETITYSANQSVYAKVASDTATLMDDYYSIVKEYLSGICGSDGICLLYRGL